MKYYHMPNQYKVVPIEAPSAEEAAKMVIKAVLEERENRAVKKKSQSRVIRPRGELVTILDTEQDKIREFELVPPPVPPIEEWIIREVDEDEDEDEDEEYDDDPL